jgi:hypothetical protein
MHRTVLDTVIFAIPEAASDGVAVEGFIERLLTWHETLDGAGWTRVVRSTSAHEALASISSYPDWQDVDQLLRRFNLRQYQAKDVMTVVRNLLEKTHPLECDLGIEDWLADPIVLVPDNQCHSWRQEIKVEHHRLAVLSCWPSDCSFTETIMLSCLPQGIMQLPVSVNTTIEACAPEPTAPPLPFTVNGIVQICSEAASFLMSVNVVQLWGSVPAAEDRMQLIKVAVYQRLRASGASHDDSWHRCCAASWSFHRRFFEAAQRYGFLHVESLIRALIGAFVATITGDELAKVHALRTGDGPQEPQRTRADGAAWRRDITYEFHLHYWKMRTSVEFACVGPHGSMEIPE